MLLHITWYMWLFILLGGYSYLALIEALAILAYCSLPRGPYTRRVVWYEVRSILTLTSVLFLYQIPAILSWCLWAWQRKKQGQRIFLVPPQGWEE